MSRAPLTYALQIGALAAPLREVRGHEQLGRDWSLAVSFVLDPNRIQGQIDDFDPDAIIKKQAVIVMERGSEPVRRLTGVITEADLSATISGHAEMNLRIEPRFCLLKHRRDIRSHREQTVPEIVSGIAAAIGVKVKLRLQDTYPVRGYSVQWRETDYDYCHRLLEDEGIFSFFTEDDVLVLGDHIAAYDHLAAHEHLGSDHALPFRHEAGLTGNEEAIFSLGARARMTPGKVTLRDWNTEHPSLDMDVSASTRFSSGPEWYDFPGEYETPEQGERKAKLTAEAFTTAGEFLTGRSSSAHLAPGRVFTLNGAPDGIDDGDLLVRRVVHKWNRTEEGFVCAFEAERADRIHRPARTTSVPTILNPLTGVVCTDGQDIQCDAFGRVKIHFPWDRIRPKDDNCSDWVPVLQDNTGGSSAIPRKDWEMVVHFLEGDPDRPVVVGRVYNGQDPPPEDLPLMRDRSSLMSKQSPSRDDANMIRFEDRGGHEAIRFLSPMFQDIRVANNQSSEIGRANTENIGRNESLSVGADASWSIEGTTEPDILNNQSYRVGGNRSVQVGHGDASAVGQNHTLDIGANHEQEVFAEVNYAAHSLTETVGGNVRERYETGHSTEVTEDMRLTVGQSLTERALTAKSEQVTGNRSESVLGSHTLNAGLELQLRVDETRSLQVAGSYLGSCPELFTLTGAERFVSHSSTADYTGSSDLVLIVSDGPAGQPGTNESWIVLRDGVLELKAMRDIIFNVTGESTLQSASSSQI